MPLTDVKLNTNCVIKEINIKDDKIKLRLMELGMLVGAKLKVANKSILKQTLLVIFNSSCFTIKADTAKNILINYV